MEVHLLQDGKRAGVFSVDQIDEMLRSGRAKPTDQVWWEGLSEWCAISSRPEFVPTPRDKNVPIRITEADVIQSSKLRLWRPRLSPGLEILSAGWVDPVMHIFSWRALRNPKMARTSIQWVGALGFVYVALLVYLALQPSFERWAGVGALWFFTIVVWHTLHGRILENHVKQLPKGTVEWRSTSGIAAAVAVAFLSLSVLGFMGDQKAGLEIGAKDAINQRIHETSSSEDFECVEVKLGKKLATDLFEAEAILDNGMKMPITIRRLEGDQITVKFNLGAMAEKLDGLR